MYSECILKSDTFFDGYAEQKYDDIIVHDGSAEDFLARHGVKGQKWGLRQYQYGDGSHTPKGRIHYGVGAFFQEYNDELYDWALTHDDLTHDDMIDVVNFLAHHGVKGQKWGLRQYQYGDGSLTPKGRIHYGVGAARDTAKNAASKVTGAIRKKVAPNKQDLEEKYQKALAKKEKREIKEAIKEAEGKKKKTKDMTDQEVAEKLRRLENERRIKQLEDDRNTVKKAAAGTGKVAVGGTVMALKGAAFVGKTAFNITKPLLNAGGQLAIDYVRKSGNKKIDDLLKDDSDRIKEGWQNAKNLYEIAQYKEKLDNMSTTSYKEARKWSQAAEISGYKKSVAESKKFISDNIPKKKSAADRMREDRKQMTRDNIDRLKLMATNGNQETREYAQAELKALRDSGAYQEIFGGGKKK